MLEHNDNVASAGVCAAAPISSEVVKMDGVQHRKKLAQILRYIATMHHSLGASSSEDNNSNNGRGGGHSFLRKASNDRTLLSCWRSFFYQESATSTAVVEEAQQRWGVIFSTRNFQQLLAMQADSATPLYDVPPFSFYAAAAASGKSSGDAKQRKRGWTDTFRNPLGGSHRNNHHGGSDGKSCWLRLTRLTTADVPERPRIPSSAVRRYLQQWRNQNMLDEEDTNAESLLDILTLESLARAPKIAPTDLAHAQQIKTFLRVYKKYLRKRAFQQQLEPMYNRLFEWIQHTEHHDELVWGLGHARMTIQDGRATVINGPLLEVLMEVELARDGALLVRPREHTGVTLNREVVTALLTTDDAATAGTSASSQHQRLTQLHRTVAELDLLQLAPGQPSTYIPLLKRIAVELSSGGTFQHSAKIHLKEGRNIPAPFQMLVSEAWCLYSRPKPSSVWARDAEAFADQLMLPTAKTLDLPKATWALTHGPGALEETRQQPKENNSDAQSGNLLSRWLWGTSTQKDLGEVHTPSPLINHAAQAPIVFPLPTSDSQNRIADLLLGKKYPAVVCEGPPGTGKTHTIANMICAYLCQGKRVLVTSKAAPALSVLRTRLPKTVQELCVDVSLSELAGMRQLQKTVERLANRVSSVETELELEKCQLLVRNIEALEKEQKEIDAELAKRSDQKRQLIQSADGQRLAELALFLTEKAPWLMKTVTPWKLEEIVAVRDRMETLVSEKQCALPKVAGCPSSPSDALFSHLSALAGSVLSSMKQASKSMIGSVPLIGSAFGYQQEVQECQAQLATTTVDGKTPQSEHDWKFVLDALRHQLAIAKFHQEVIEPLVLKDDWPISEIYDNVGEHRVVKASFLQTVGQVIQLKELAEKLDVSEEMVLASQCNTLDARRSLIAIRIQRLAADLVDAKVVTELSRSFSSEAQSALIRFAQIAGKAKFSRSSQPSKMTARQRRHRQEYLDAFDKCVRYIPCWILTSSQISDYLPPESLFDLVVLDEASQSDITVLPGMLRGKQLLIVGDGKQVSPTESFISEESIDSLRAALPRCPLEDSLLPGQSFFDLCAQAYPRGRVVLSEHFRCSPEIISFSNHQFYDSRLVPLRLPTSNERLAPSLIDVRVARGAKVGKTNEAECDEIVRMVHNFVMDTASLCSPEPRSIGIISLVGNEQASLIRGRLLDRIGPQKFKEHNILIGDPPTFQGAERDIVFLSMVCSAGSVVPQTRLMHAQRMNVALSRARDRMVLVRSLDAQHIANSEDMKLPVIEFFEAAKNQDLTEDTDVGDNEDGGDRRQEANSSFSFRARAEDLLECLLKKRGFTVRSMGVVWNNALCVEHPGSSSRAAICVENGGETKQEWLQTVTQQKSIERVGWKCLRVDGLSLLIDYHAAFAKVVDFLATAGVEEPPIIYDSLEEENNDGESDQNPAGVGAEAKERAGGEANDQVMEDAAGAAEGSDIVVVISSDEDNGEGDPLESDDNDQVDANQFGEVVQNNFLFLGKGRNANKEDNDEEEEEQEEEDDGDDDDDSEPYATRVVPNRNRRARRRSRSASRNPADSDREAMPDSVSSRRGQEGSRDDDSKPRAWDANKAKKMRANQSFDSEADSMVARKRDRSRMKSSSRSPRRDRGLLEDSESELDENTGPSPLKKCRTSRVDGTGGDGEYLGDTSDADEAGSGSDNDGKRRRKSYRRLDKYARDGRFYPARQGSGELDQFDYDTESDLPSDGQGKLKGRGNDDEDYELFSGSDKN